MRIYVSLVALLGVLVSAGCQVDPRDAPLPEVASSPLATSLPTSAARDTATPDRIAPTKLPERVPLDQATDQVIGEIPRKILDSILKDLAEQTGATPEKIGVVQAQAIVWNDGSLGCPQPGMFYTQALVNGYWVVLQVDGNDYDYRVSDTGYFFLCGGVPPKIPPGSTPSGLLPRNGNEQEMTASITADLASRLGSPIEEIGMVSAGVIEVPLGEPCGTASEKDETGPIGSGLTLGQEILLQHGEMRNIYVVIGSLAYFCGER